MSKTEPAGRLARWALKIQEFDIIIRYRPGKSHQNADTLTRTPIVPLAKVETRSTGTKEKSEVKNENVEAKEPRTKQVIFEIKIDQSKDTGKWIELQHKDEYCRAILQEMAKTNSSKEVKNKFKINEKGLLADIRGRTVTPVLVNNIFTKYGSPEVVLTDQGTDFLSSLIQEVCKQFKVKQIRTTAYRPQTHGLVERFNRTLCDMLACNVSDQPANWDKYFYLAFVTFAYNTAKQASTQETPFFLFFGREPIMPNDIKINRRYETYEDTSMV
ncbi:Uncharacterized protein APZ42_028003 [Daphnia magna]|uniref:Integrase catalytic domain-containing protein n=1 Tax=Daphnia magna TaxID=35525 RepID=A0A164QWQ0_9CRUS|nr:Uncharacterized protein APZ42_028003 [Daphnia magna]